jgi:hypothetical protein
MAKRPKTLEETAEMVISHLHSIGGMLPNRYYINASVAVFEQDMDGETLGPVGRVAWDEARGDWTWIGLDA